MDRGATRKLPFENLVSSPGRQCERVLCVAQTLDDPTQCEATNLPADGQELLL